MCAGISCHGGKKKEHMFLSTGLHMLPPLLIGLNQVASYQSLCSAPPPLSQSPPLPLLARPHMVLYTPISLTVFPSHKHPISVWSSFTKFLWDFFWPPYVAHISATPPHYCARQTLAPAPTVSSVYLCLLRFPFSPSHAPSFLNITSDFVRHASFSHATPSITVYYTISAMKNLLFLTPVPLRPSTDNICAHPIARAYECS